MRDNDPNKIIATRRHDVIKEKLAIWRQISDSYIGGKTYCSGNYLHRYSREPKSEYNVRKERAVFLNHVQPLADVLAGFIYANEPTREVPDDLKYLIEKASKQKSLNKFMLTVAIHSLQYTVAVLVDSPSFDPEQVKTAADRQNLKLNPFCTMYMPWQIRDFAIDDSGELLWILLDNSFVEKDNPKVAEQERIIYRLWTREYFQDFEIPEKDEDIKEGPEVPHFLGVVPVSFVSWKDKDEDLISESPFEDIALLDQSIYNALSLLDEMLTAGTFKVLFFPVTKKDDLPLELKYQGVGDLSVIPFPGDVSNPPFFAGATLEDIANFVVMLEFYLSQLFDKVGLGTDKEKKFVQSGKAKELDFEKAEALLRHGAESLENCEKDIFRFAGLWEGKNYTEKDIKISYEKEFQSEEVDLILSRLYGVLTLGYKSLRKIAVMKIAQKITTDLNESDKQALMKELEGEIEKADLELKVDTDKLSEAELRAREKKASDADGGNDE